MSEGGYCFFYVSDRDLFGVEVEFQFAGVEEDFNAGGVDSGKGFRGFFDFELA